MSGKPFALAVILLAFSSLLFWPESSRSQDLELALERILNPVPDYDPFEKPVAPQQFFPDAVDKKSRELLIDALTHQPDSLKDHLKFLQQEDSRLLKQHRTTTGLTERAQDLVNNTIQDRERYLKAQKEALKNA